MLGDSPPAISPATAAISHPPPQRSPGRRESRAWNGRRPRQLRRRRRSRRWSATIRQGGDRGAQALPPAPAATPPVPESRGRASERGRIIIRIFPAASLTGKKRPPGRRPSARKERTPPAPEPERGGLGDGRRAHPCDQPVLSRCSRASISLRNGVQAPHSATLPPRNSSASLDTPDPAWFEGIAAERSLPNTAYVCPLFDATLIPCTG